MLRSILTIIIFIYFVFIFFFHLSFESRTLYNYCHQSVYVDFKENNDECRRGNGKYTHF